MVVASAYDEATRAAHEKQAEKAMREARTMLIMNRDPGNLKKSGNPATAAFFAVLAMRLELRAEWGVQTAATDGRLLVYNPAWVMRLTPENRVGIICHEVMHCAMKHASRRQGRDRRRWNIACDLAINSELVRCGFKLPSKGCIPGVPPFEKAPADKSAEWYYDALQNHAGGTPQPAGGQGQGEGGEGQEGDQDDPGGNGGVMEPGDGSQADQNQVATEWEVAVAQAHRSARERGKLAAGLERLVQETLKPKVDWREVLREFVTRHARNDYRWFPPNRRHIHAGLYLPGMRSEELGDLIVAVDTSGSINARLLAAFGAEIQAIVEQFDAKVTILYCDARIQGVEEYTSQDGQLKLKMKGGGGTSHVPVFEWVDKNGGDSPCVVCLTDLYTEFPDKAPTLPVLWCVYGNARPSAPFGQIVEVE